MAVDSHHLLLSPPQLFSNRDLTIMNHNTTMEAFCNQTGYGVVSPFSVTDDTPPLLMYGGGGGSSTPTTVDSFTYYGGAVTNLESDSFFPFTSRKRNRDQYQNHHLLHNQNPRSSCVTSTTTTTTTTTPFSFLGQDIDISSHMNQQQHEIDRFVSLHMESVKLEIEEKRKRQARTIMEAIEQGLAKRLRVKEEEREGIVKINQALEERVKSLSVENQIWRDLAQSNEATANHLRTNLQQILAQVKAPLANVRENDDDMESYCGSSAGDEEETVRRTLAVCRRRRRN